MLNSAMDSVLLVKGWKKSANWSFPRGKINKDEDDLDCAVREVYEETGYDLREAGLVPSDEQVKYIEITMREQHMRLYVFKNVPMDTHFEPRTRKEISKIQWYRLSELPAFRKKGQTQTQDGVEAAVNANKFYMVAPFLVPLKKWIVEQKKKDAQRALSNQQSTMTMPEEIWTEEELVFDRRSSHAVPLAPEPKMGSVPGIDTMEGATAALHRLLKIQPPTQGLQPEASSAVQSPASKNSGEALLALLQGKSTSSGQVVAQPDPPPHTPLDLTYTNAPIPGTPQHHHQKPLIPPYSVPPPHFRLQPQGGPYLHQNAQQPFVQHTTNNIPLQENQMPNPLFPQPRLQGYVQQQYHSQQLQHPQPLPPQVQRALFSGDQAHGPVVPPYTYQQEIPQHIDSPLSTQQQPHFPNVHQPMITQVKQTPPKLTSHSLALLNAFKNHGDPASLSHEGHNDLPHPAQLQELSADEGQQEKPSVPDMSGFNMSASVPAPQLYPARALPSDDHRTSLLSMFKAPGTNVPALNPTATITTPADIQQGSGASSSRHPSVDPALSNALKPAQKVSSGKPQPQSHVSGSPSSFRPVSILSRPAHDHVTNSPPEERAGDNHIPNHIQSRVAPVKETMGLHGHDGTSGDQLRTFQPQILKRPQPVKQSVPAELAAPTLTNQPGASAQHTLDRRTTQAPEQKQTLLSLFKKASISEPPAQPQAQLTQLQERAPENFSGVLLRSRVDSVTSGGGDILSEGSSRRSSHAPMSPGDKGFLLGYLGAITRGKEG